MPRISIRDPSSSTIDDPRSLRALHPVKTKRKRQTSLREISVIWTRGFSTRGILSRGYRSTSRMASRFSLETNYVGVFIHVASRCVHQLPPRDAVPQLPPKLAGSATHHGPRRGFSFSFWPVAGCRLTRDRIQSRYHPTAELSDVRGPPVREVRTQRLHILVLNVRFLETEVEAAIGRRWTTQQVRQMAHDPGNVGRVGSDWLARVAPGTRGNAGPWLAGPFRLGGPPPPPP